MAGGRRSAGNGEAIPFLRKSSYSPCRSAQSGNYLDGRPKIIHDKCTIIPGPAGRWTWSAGSLARKDWIFGALLLVAVVTTYQPAWHGAPLWDDNAHLTKPELRSLGGLLRIWTEPGATQQYYPLVHTVFWVGHRLWGEEPFGYHLLNIVLHAFSAFLLYKILRSLSIPGAWLAAALFALHPIEVESVAWISELKNCLSGVFFFGAVLSYLQFDRKRTVQPYLISFGVFALGLMAKTAIAPMPAAMMAILWWKRPRNERLRWKNDLLPLLPFLLAGISFGIFTAWIERRYVIGQEEIDFNYSFVGRCLIAGHAIWFYLGKLAFPRNLTFIYPRWEVSETVWRHYLYPLGVAVLSAACWLFRHRSKAPFTALAYFIAMLFPALGFFTIFPFRYAFVADHFQYLAGVGPLVLASALLILVLSRMGKRFSPAALLPPVTLIAVLATLTWRQCGIYADAETLYKAVIGNTPACLLAYNNLGLEYQRTGRLDEAMTCYRKAIEISPTSWGTRFNLGDALMRGGRIDEAIEQYRKALDCKPDYAEAEVGLGLALMATDKAVDAIDHFRKALAINPRFIPALLNLGGALLKVGQADDAAACFRKVVELNPADLTILNNLCGIFLRLGRLDDAIDAAGEAMALAKTCGREDLAREIARNIDDIRRAQEHRNLQRNF